MHRCPHLIVDMKMRSADEMMTGDDLWEQFNPPVDEDVKSKCVHVLRAAYEQTMKAEWE